MRRELGMLAAFIGIGALLYFSNHTFLEASNVDSTTKEIARLGIFAVGEGLVIITGGIDLSVGSVIGLTGVIIAKLSSSAVGTEYLHQQVWIGITVAMAVALAIGLFQGLLITRMNLQPFIVTLGGMLLFRGVAQVISEGNTMSMGGSSSLPPIMEQSLWQIGNWTILSTPVLIFLIVLVLGVYLLHFTVFGRYLYAIGGSRDAAEYSGIPVKRVELLTYIISAGLAGVAGVVGTYVGAMTHTNGMGYELPAIAAVVIGGCSLRGGEGSILGMLIGCGIIRVINNGINLFKYSYRDAAGNLQEFKIGTNWEFVITGSVILLAVMLDQIVHALQARRRIRKAGQMAAAAAPLAAPEPRSG
jgi:ribose transport system permease protein